MPFIGGVAIRRRFTDTKELETERKKIDAIEICRARRHSTVATTTSTEAMNKNKIIKHFFLWFVCCRFSFRDRAHKFVWKMTIAYALGAHMF